MNIQELGSLGEFVGAIAVMVTLVYLAIQTRLTRKAAEVTQRAAEETAKFSSQQMTQGVTDMYSRLRLARMNLDFAQLLVKARGSERLTDAEQEVFSAMSEELFFTASASYESAMESATVHPGEGDIAYLSDYFKNNPKLISEWRRVSPTISTVSARYVETIDRLLDEKEIAQQDD